MVDGLGMVGRTVTFRMPVLALLSLPFCLTMAGLVLLHLAGEHHSAPVGSAGFYLIFSSVGLLVLGLVLRVQLSPAGVRIRSLQRRRLIGWAEIYAITVQPQRRGGPRVTLWTAYDGRIKLPLPIANKAWNEAAFVRDYHQIGQYWLATRNPDQRPLAGHWSAR
jgi:hypothetical protein